MSDKKPYDTSIARMAGNIAAGIIGCVEPSRVTEAEREQTVDLAVDLAQRIVRRLTAVSTDPRCPKCGYTMCELFDEIRLNPLCSEARPTGQYECRVCVSTTAKESR